MSAAQQFLDMQTIETLIDRHGMEKIQDMLASICAEKAEHLRANWNDEIEAERWEAIADACHAASVVIDKA